MNYDDLTWNDGYFDAQMGGFPLTAVGEYYMGYLAGEADKDDSEIF
jgi:hypothetical protein